MRNPLNSSLDDGLGDCRLQSDFLIKVDYNRMLQVLKSFENFLKLVVKTFEKVSHLKRLQRTSKFRTRGYDHQRENSVNSILGT